MLRENRPFTEPRLAIIAGTPALVERAEAKSASVTAVLAEALQKRGVEAKLATLAARAGMAAFGHAASCWREDPSLGLQVHLEQAFLTLQGLSQAGGR
jgi:hypothetical protein